MRRRKQIVALKFLRVWLGPCLRPPEAPWAALAHGPGGPIPAGAAVVSVDNGLLEGGS